MQVHIASTFYMMSMVSLRCKGNNATSVLVQRLSNKQNSTLGRNGELARHSPLPSEARSSYANKMMPCCTAPRMMSSGKNNHKKHAHTNTHSLMTDNRLL